MSSSVYPDMFLPFRKLSGISSFPASAMYRHVFRVTSHLSFFFGFVAAVDSGSETTGTFILGGPGPVPDIVLGNDAMTSFSRNFLTFFSEICFHHGEMQQLKQDKSILSFAAAVVLLLSYL